jgi:hypothetical protein
VKSFKRFEEFMGRKTSMKVLVAERHYILDDYISVAWVPDRGEQDEG